MIYRKDYLKKGFEILLLTKIPAMRSILILFFVAIISNTLTAGKLINKKLVLVDFQTDIVDNKILKNTSKLVSKNTNKLIGTASFYADKFIGRKTANGQTYHPKKLTAACNVLPLGTWIKVTNMKNMRSVIVQINDRLHPKNKRIVDLSHSAALQLDYMNQGLAKVKVEDLGKKKPQI
jgi:rare lipoprotein A